MKKIILLLMIAIIGCTLVDMPGDSIYDSVNTFKSKKPNFNGYNPNTSIAEGRNHVADYKRILIHGGQYTAMTVLAYDCSKTNDGKNILVYVWDSVSKAWPLYMALQSLVGDFKYNDAPKGCPNIVLKYKKYMIYCDRFTLDASRIALLNKNEAEAYLKEHPETVLFKGNFTCI
jgi:hypothetical protein